MTEIFVNLKRFDVPRKLGGVCPEKSPEKWIRSVFQRVIELGMGDSSSVHLTFFLPEALILPAIDEVRRYPSSKTTALEIGCQGVFRENITPGGNFGAFTSNLPAAAAANLGCTWAMIGHSEERKDKYDMMVKYDPAILTDPTNMRKANYAVNALLNSETMRAFESGLNVLFCVGETAEERGPGSFAEQKPRVVEVLRSQLEVGLKGATEHHSIRRITIGYEPRWAIGPGKIPPSATYIEFVSSVIKEETKKAFGFSPPIVYGGGLKEENAAEIAAVKNIDGGLVALTRFTGEIAFEPEGLRSIIEKYLGGLYCGS